MPGYPNKITRAALGPTYQNATKIGNPKEEIDASVFNLMAWQVAGLSGTAPRAVIIGRANVSTPDFLKQWLAWDPNGTLGPTIFTRTGVGAYTWALPGTGTYSDMNGNAVAVNVEFAFAFVMTDANRNMVASTTVDSGGGYTGTMNCFSGGAASEIGAVGVTKLFCLVLI